jgi:hypothetical protein
MSNVQIIEFKNHRLSIVSYQSEIVSTRKKRRTIEDEEDVDGEVDVEYIVTLKEPWLSVQCELELEVIGDEVKSIPTDSYWVDENKFQWHHRGNGRFRNITSEVKEFKMPTKIGLCGMMCKEG